MKKLLYLKILTFYFIVSISNILFAKEINHIEVIGNKRISEDYIRSLLVSKEGTNYSDIHSDRDLKILYNTDLFSNIKIDFQNNTLTVSIEENPLIENVEIVGNKGVKTDTITSEIRTEKRNTFSLNKLESDIQRIINIYYQSGYLSVIANYEIIEKENNIIDIKINIEEGEKLKISKVKIIGNNNFSEDILKDIILTKEHRWWRFLNSTSIYDRNRILYEGELLRQFYLENGYPNFSVVSNFTELSVDTSFIVTYVLEEGERYKFGESSVIINVPELKRYQAEIENSIKFNQDDWFKNSLLQRETNNIRLKIEDYGYQFIAVNSQMVFNDVTKKVNIVFIISEERKKFLNSINFSGNSRTLDYVLRRELKMVEGDAYSSAKENIARLNLQRTGYFSAVNFYQRQVEEGMIDLDIQVEEVSTGSISIGGGYSTVDGLQFEAGYSDSNLLGTGKYLGFSTTLAETSNLYNISLTEPYFLNRELAASISLYRQDTGADSANYYDTYQITDQGTRFSLGYRLTNQFRHTVGYSYSYRNIYNVSDYASRSIKEIEGIDYISIFSNSISYDSRDSGLYPKRGILASLDTQYAGALDLGTVNYIKNTFKFIWYYNVYEDIVFSVLGSAGVIKGLAGDDVNIIDKYILGGYTLRGFSLGSTYGGIGPYDIQSGESLGGSYMYRGSFQLEMPVPSVQQYGLLVYAFSDFGTVTDFNNSRKDIIDIGSLRVSVGVGISWRSPAGVISLDFGVPVKQEDTDSTERIYLNFGTRM